MEYDEFASNILSKLNQRWKFLAIMTNGKPISIATNLEKTHPITERYFPNKNKRTHAEVRCLQKAPKEKIVGSTIYVYRLKKNGFGLSKPCTMCFNEMGAAGVKEVFYTTDSGFVRLKL